MRSPLAIDALRQISVAKQLLIYGGSVANARDALHVTAETIITQTDVSVKTFNLCE
jgi:hypothetical protein